MDYLLKIKSKWEVSSLSFILNFEEAFKMKKNKSINF